MKIEVSDNNVVRSVHVSQVDLGLCVIINTHRRGCYISLDSGSSGPNLSDCTSSLGISDDFGGSEWPMDDTITFIPESIEEKVLLNNPRWDQYCKDQIVLLYVGEEALEQVKFITYWEG